MHKTRRSAAAAAAALVVAAAYGAAGTAMAKPALRAQMPDRPRPSAAPRAFRDRVITPALRATAAQYFGGPYPAPDGTAVTVYMSNRYQPDAAIAQAWATFFGSLLHGDELASVTVFLAPYEEMQARCGSPEADSCYDMVNRIIYLVGGTPPDGASLVDIAAHEYGHHVANTRHNDPWDAGRWGPKYWATRMHVCENEGRSMYPGAEDERYPLNPGEGWAETFRVLNAVNPSAWPIVDDMFYPDAGDLAAARRDVLDPWQGPMYTDYRGQFRARGARMRFIPIRVQNDGDIKITLKANGSLDADLFLLERRSANEALDSASHKGRREKLAGTYCGYRRLWLGVWRQKGSGRYKLRVTLPWTT